MAFGLGFPEEHEVRGQPASTKQQEVLSHAWFCSSFRTTQNFGLREVVNSVARALGWFGIVTLALCVLLLRARVGQSISLCFVPA